MAALASLAACSADLSPGEILLSTRITVADSTPRELVVEAPANSSVLITVSGHAVDVRARIGYSPGRAMAVADAPNRRMGIETLLVEAGHPGVIAIRIERNDHPGAGGHADVMAVALPLVSDSDRRRLEAARLEAQACLDYPDVERGQASAEAFAKAARLHAQNRDRRREGLALLQAAGVRYTRLTDWQRAAELASRAAPLLKRADALEYAAFAARVEGAALDQRANASDAEPAARERTLGLARERLTQAAEQFQVLGNAYEAGYALNYRGVSFHMAGDQVQARKDYLDALALFRSVGDKPAQALSLQSLALQSHQDGRLSDAMHEFDSALELIPREEDPENYAHTLHNSAWPLRAVGRFDDAVARFYAAGEILRKRGDRDGEARALHGLATTLMHAGEPERASELLDVAIKLRGQTGARREQAISLNVLGQIEQDAGQFALAITHHLEALSLATAPHDVAQIRLALASAQIALGKREQARKELLKILRLGLPATHRYLGLSLAELATLESLAGRIPSSFGYFARAIEVLRDNGSDIEHARTLVRRAEARLRMGDSAEAIIDADIAVAQLDEIGLYTLQAESRAAFRASYRDAIELQIAALLEQAAAAQKRGSDVRAQQALRLALTTSDNGRAQLLADTEAIREEELPEEMLKRRRNDYEVLAGKRQQRDRLSNSATPDDARIAELTRDIARLRTEVSFVEREIAGSSRLARNYARSNSTRDLIGSIPNNSVVVEYFVGRAHTWMFEVRKNRVTVHEIGTSAEVEKLTRQLHFEWRSYGKSSTDRFNTSRRLAVLLFGKLSELAPDETLFVIPDGPLHVVPIAVIARQAKPTSPTRLVQVATALASNINGKTFSIEGPERLLAVIADPIYSADDSRIRGAVSARPASTGNVILTRHARDLAKLSRLPSTSIEAKAIAVLAADGSDALELLGADATRRNVAAARLDRYRFVHFATHAFADSEDPALATLALSRFDRDGSPLDGDLRSFDIARLRLNADLVVLSACNTAIGREIAGEAPLGLSQAFLRSGARSVLATLWQVADTSTAKLMEVFYYEMLVNSQPPAVALDLAQQSIRRIPRWSDPYFWAGFQLISNARLEARSNNVERRGSNDGRRSVRRAMDHDHL